VLDGVGGRARFDGGFLNETALQGKTVGAGAMRVKHLRRIVEGRSRPGVPPFRLCAAFILDDA